LTTLTPPHGLRPELPPGLRPELPPEQFAAELPKHVVSASVLLTDPADRVLMLHQSVGYPGHPAWWQLPGGLADADEPPQRTAVRELREESGLELADDLPLLLVDYRSASGGWPPVIDFCFDGGTVAADQPIQLSAEHDGYAWRSHREWQRHLQPEQSAWFAALWRARGGAAPGFVHDGRRPGAGRRRADG
jgi:8-oxo-dGTP pyrophosphatase MutT (NUDIX family)